MTSSKVTAAPLALAALLALGPAIAQTPPAGDEPAPVDEAPRHTRPKRQGPNPCMTPDPGFGIYDPWEPVALGHMIAPGRGGIRRDGGFDLVVHFHGHEPARKEFVKAGGGVVLVGIDLGIGSGPYETSFADPSLFPRIVASVEERMKKRSGNAAAHVRHLALSSWSAGYGATSEILKQPAGKKVDAVVLLDSLHAGYEPGSNPKRVRGSQIAQFTEYARAAAAGRGLFFLSHSSIVPPGYASTTEVADYLVRELGGSPRKAKRHDALGLAMIDRYDRGGVHVRGYEGDDKPDHCAHLGLLADVLKVHLVPAWKTPPGRAR